MTTEGKLNLNGICAELGLEPQFLLELAERASGLYDTFDRPKRSGGVRTISVPHDKLKWVQRVFLSGLLCRIPMPPHVHGCVKGRSIVTNARGHVNRPLVINIDLSNFFGTISLQRVMAIFETMFNCDEATAETLARLTTYGNFLPQGAPTSPTLANIAALELDQHLIDICTKNKSPYEFHYSRYVDDITISGGNDLVFLLDEFYKAVEKNGFRANPNKLRVARPNCRQRVTGVVVNQKLNSPKKLIRKVRQQLYFCKKFGLKGHCEKLAIEPDLFLQQLKGRIGFIRMTRDDRGQ